MKIFVCAVAVATVFCSWPSGAQTNRAGSAARALTRNARVATNATPNGPGISQNEQTDEFDTLAGPDLLAGLAGDREAFDRAMKLCAETLAKNPKHARALVWHGSGMVFLATQAFAARDLANATNFWQRGMSEMDSAVTLEPENVRVLLPRGRTLLAVSRHAPDLKQARALLQTGIADYEKALQLEKPRFSSLSPQARGELLFGLADGWHRLGNTSRATLCFQRVIEECEGSSFADQARVWLGTRDLSALPDSPQTAACTSCHKR